MDRTNKKEYDLTKNWYRKTDLINELWHGMKMPTLNRYVREMKNSPYDFGICGGHGNIFIHSIVFKDWFDWKNSHEFETKIA
ncbi:hypothetical protein FACS1894193_02330 [Bacilli bacterium]|nr:hypothetical protein FACS1894193_02330 [Bacilli bacterium]